ncbi:MAG: hypothetical protein C4530_23610 [Desulfobacteraceae bacterium]|nr:MAG: hypothetical protein C4530_23610 [Desulfobacteraceae bacterium]
MACLQILQPIEKVSISGSNMQGKKGWLFATIQVHVCMVAFTGQVERRAQIFISQESNQDQGVSGPSP